MDRNFWRKLKKPFFVMAPMSDITDFAMRQMLVKYGKPDVLFTEFVSADGLADKKGREALLRHLHFYENERPIVAQIFGAKAENMKKAAQTISQLGFDGIDINMGCPDKSIVDQGAGSALIRNPERAREIIRAVKEGAGDIPVSVKTRIGWNENEIETWLPELLAEKPAAITVHARTKKEIFSGEAHWDAVERAVEMAKGSGVVIIGNGHVKSRKDGVQKARKSGAAGIMAGMAVLGNPWFFDKKTKIEKIPIKQRLEVMIEHAELFEKALVKKGIKNYDAVKKHYGFYARGFDGAKELRTELMKEKSTKGAGKVVKKFLGNIV